MGWSTREIADLAGTTVNTVRHYHRERLLAEPERTSNGYKQYGVPHLVRLLQIRRLRDLGVPLDQIEQVGVSGDTSATALRAIDADLAASIERLQRARAEIRAILDGSSLADLPPGFDDVAVRLSAPDRSLMLIYSQLYDDAAMADLRRMIDDEADPTGADAVFDSLPADADEPTRQRIAEQYATTIARAQAEYPWLTDPTGRISKSLAVTSRTVAESVAALYNEAQLDVLMRATVIARERAEKTVPEEQQQSPEHPSRGG
jgi:DNA-binding transcriptional MerR regulator